MALLNTEVLISGASVAGPTLAYWLRRYGFSPTVIERTPALRKGYGGHAVDLFGPAVDVTEWMGVLPQVSQARTRTERISFARPGKAAFEVDMSKLVAGIAGGRHIEIMRGELASILHEATRDDVEYVFGDSIRTIEQQKDGVFVTFEHGPSRTVGLVIGADGLHLTVRRLTFGDESRFLHYIGGYLGFFTVPNYLGLDGRMVTYTTAGKLAAMYPVRQTGQARAGFLFKRAEPIPFDHRDVEQHRKILREVYAGEGWEVPRLLAELDSSDDLYFDSISQVIMDTWTSGRVTLVGDAGFSSGPAVGGGTSVAMVGAYVLAGELAAAGGEHTTGFANYEDEMREFVRRSREVAPTTMRTLIPSTPTQVWIEALAMRTIPRLPGVVQRRLSSLQGGAARTMESITLKRYEATR
jgi:2-polyprenyl-6-methoxyphenol hydroxylase-like FAD-dependent oxidoreductase